MIGKELEHPFIEGRTMKIIGDGVLVDMSFGTGAVKITPAHDHNDYACGKRHGLAQINVFDEDGKIKCVGALRVAVVCRRIDLCTLTLI